MSSVKYTLAVALHMGQEILDTLYLIFLVFLELFWSYEVGEYTGLKT